MAWKDLEMERSILEERQEFVGKLEAQLDKIEAKI